MLGDRVTPRVYLTPQERGDRTASSCEGSIAMLSWAGCRSGWSLRANSPHPQPALSSGRKLSSLKPRILPRARLWEGTRHFPEQGSLGQKCLHSSHCWEMKYC